MYREFDHTAPVDGRMTTFAMLEYPQDEPPTTVQVDGTTWVRIDKLPTAIANGICESLHLEQ